MAFHSMPIIILLKKARLTHCPLIDHGLGFSFSCQRCCKQTSPVLLLSSQITLVFPQNNDIGCLLHGMIPSGGVLGLRLSTGFSESFFMDKMVIFLQRRKT